MESPPKDIPCFAVSWEQLNPEQVSAGVLNCTCRTTAACTPTRAASLMPDSQDW